MNRTAAFWCAPAVALAIATIGLIGLNVNSFWASKAQRLRATATPSLYTVVDLGTRDRYGQRSRIRVVDSEQRQFFISLDGSATRVHQVGSPLLARKGNAGSEDAGTLMPEDVVQASWWHWYGFPVIALAVAVGIMVLGFYQLPQPRRRPGTG